jgi:hypothetical protein
MERPKVGFSELALFLAQVLSVFVIICVSLLNLTLEWGNQNLWTLMLTVSLGYIMPNPKMEVITAAMEKYKGELNEIAS